MSERDFQTKVLRLAKLYDWLAYHTFDSRRSQSGFPDLVLVKAGRPVIFAELKSETGKPTVAQVEWLDALRKTNARAFLWRPCDLENIARILGV